MRSFSNKIQRYSTTQRAMRPQRLQDQIARLKRDSSNSSKPPSSDIVKPKKKGMPRGRRTRKIDAQKGHPRHERIPIGPDDVGSIVPYELSPKQAQGLIPWGANMIST